MLVPKLKILSFLGVPEIVLLKELDGNICQKNLSPERCDAAVELTFDPLLTAHYIRL